MQTPGMTTRRIAALLLLVLVGATVHASLPQADLFSHLPATLADVAETDLERAPQPCGFEPVAEVVTLEPVWTRLTLAPQYEAIGAFSPLGKNRHYRLFCNRQPPLGLWIQKDGPFKIGSYYYIHIYDRGWIGLKSKFIATVRYRANDDTGGADALIAEIVVNKLAAQNGLKGLQQAIQAVGTAGEIAIRVAFDPLDNVASVIEFVDDPSFLNALAMLPLLPGGFRKLDELKHIDELKHADNLKHARRSVSTGRTTPRNLKEQLAIEQVKAKPSGTTPPRMPKMSDTKNNLLHEDGWVKRVQNVNDVEIHYVENINTLEVLDFKFKD